jgi:hypothetical protein
LSLGILGLKEDFVQVDEIVILTKYNKNIK